MKRAAELIVTSLFCVCFFCEANALTKTYGYAVFGKLKYPENFTHYDYVNPNAPKGGVVTLYNIGGYDSLSSFILKGTAAPQLNYTFDTLLVSSSDEPYSTYPLVAESLEYPDDKKWVIFNLRPEAKWHDGKPITAHDVLFSFNILKDKGNPNYKVIFEDVEKAEVINDRKIKFYISNPLNPLVISVIGENLTIIPKHFFADKDFETYHDKPILSSGPYRVKSFAFNKYIEYERVDDYWGKDLPVNRGSYNFQKMQVECYLDTTVAVEAFKAGAYDFREENISRVWATAYDIPAVHKGELIKETAKHNIPAPLQTTFLNIRKPDLQDINFRKALTFAFDFDWMNKHLFYNVYKRTESYFDNSKFKATGIPQDRELQVLLKYKDQLPEELFIQEFKIPTTGANSLRNRENLKQAKQLLLSSGYKIVNNKMISPYTKKAVEVEILYHMPQFERVFNAFKANLEKIGITLVLRQVDHSPFWERSKVFNFDLQTFAFFASLVPGIPEKLKWHSESDVEGGYNFSGVHSKVVDELINNMIKASNEQDLIVYSRALDRVLLWNYYSIPQMYSNEFRYLYWNKFGIPEVKPSYYIGIDTWWAKSAE
jgi:microcin C transport system substrate-binding protein